jgi:2-polyprenyl-3-methyl-5-hydroxy-6-metoxy-1,4-benzoquinol methylase
MLAKGSWRDYSSPYEIGRSTMIAEALNVVATPAARVLELGCFDGTYSVMMADRVGQVTAVDYDPEALRLASELGNTRPNISYLQHDLNAPLPPDIAWFDIVTAFEVIEHLTNPVAFLTDVVGHMADEATLLLSTPNLTSPEGVIGRLRARRNGQTYQAWDPTHVSLFTTRKLTAAIRSAGLRVTDVTGFHYRSGPLPVLGHGVGPANRACRIPVLNRLGFNVLVTARKPAPAVKQ